MKASLSYGEVKWLNELMLIIKQSLKLLDAFGFSLKDKIVFFVRQANKITRAIVVFNSVKVVDNPIFRELFALSFLPYQDMFKHHTPPCRSMMAWQVDVNITTSCDKPAAYSFLSFFIPILFQFLSSWACYPTVFNGARKASFGYRFLRTAFPTKVNGLGAIRTEFRNRFNAAFIITGFAPLSSWATFLPAVKADRGVLLSPTFSFFLRPHNTIITQSYLNSNGL